MKEKVEKYNNKIEGIDKPLSHPCLNPKIVHISRLKANEYNPNKVPDTELDLLEKSIREDELTMPIVTYKRDDGDYEIVDGFHRFLVMKDRLNEEWIPITVIDKSIDERMMSTVRHNRARGDHMTELMGDLVKNLEEQGKTPEEIAEGLGMEEEEITRLKQVIGAAKMLSGDEYSQSWGVIDEE